ncbi:Cysteine-rich transmembrane CYSTM domain-containing protein [Dioscorea alata]|uniref:Cysteine-rich transmembrane CYSTM domain-containing protein n=1 Tax=Dioscorea alata TaxID=55571 RepID=A0ACB7UMR0_DIOAL|nr:Cysteine-rich transmembrane CYSTM domain-containing protein [Dioscorea alata]
MSSYNQQQAPPPSYPPAGQAYPAPAEGYPTYAAPPPAGYPTKDEAAYPQNAPAQTQSRGEGGFWEGCCAALCCCCLLDMCT